MTAASAVYRQLLKSFPPDAVAWVNDSIWHGPVNVPWA